MHEPLNIIFAGGGTGGHLFPAIAIAQEFKARNTETGILFLSTGRPVEVSVLPKYGFSFRKISAGGIKGKNIYRQTEAIVLLFLGICESIRVLRDFGPHLVIGMGGYSSVPVVLAARVLRIPVVLCEQNILPGIANRFLSGFADRIYTAFEQTFKKLPENKVRFTGNPVRQEILEVSGQKDNENRPFTVLILGGSQGAHAINGVVVDALKSFQDDQRFFFIHQTGAADENLVKAAYGANRVPCRVKAFFKNMARVYQNADLAVCRAGATTVAEMSALGIPALFIPFPHAADDHQVLNARTLCESGASEMIYENDLTAELLAERIFHLASHRSELEHMASKALAMGRPDAAEKIVDDCCMLLGLL